MQALTEGVSKHILQFMTRLLRAMFGWFYLPQNVISYIKIKRACLKNHIQARKTIGN